MGPGKARTFPVLFDKSRKRKHFEVAVGGGELAAITGRPDGSVIIDTRINTAGFGKGAAGLKTQFQGLSKAAGKLGMIIAAAFSVKAIVTFSKEAIALGSDLQEVQNVVDVTFTTMNEQINEFAKNAAIFAVFPRWQRVLLFFPEWTQIFPLPAL